MGSVFGGGRGVWLGGGGDRWQRGVFGGGRCLAMGAVVVKGHDENRN